MTDKFRQAADSENFPYGEDTTPFIMVKGGKVTWAGRKTDKIAMLKERGGKILAVWPGKWSSDVFEINDRVRALAVLGDSLLATSLIGDIAAALGEHALATLDEDCGYFRRRGRRQADRSTPPPCRPQAPLTLRNWPWLRGAPDPPGGKSQSADMSSEPRPNGPSVAPVRLHSPPDQMCSRQR